jgi:cell division protein FtsW
MSTLVHPTLDDASVAPAAARRDRPASEGAILVLVVLALMAVGMLMVYSASRKAYAEGDTMYFVKHLIFVPTALLVMYLGWRVRYDRLNCAWVAWSVLLSAVVLLVGVLLLGEEHGGARRWYRIPLGEYSLSFQPSEYAKLALVVFLAWFFSRPEAKPRSFFRSFLPSMMVTGVVGILIVKEDFGTAALVGAVAVGLCMVAGWRLWYPLFLIVPGIIGFYKYVWLEDFRRTRIEVWLDPWKYFNGPGWHVCQSLMGISCGGLTGVGLGAGIQKLYIPEVTTDFIFAAICEEMGLLGGLLVIGLFVTLIWRAGRIIRAAPDRFAFLLASGILLTIGLQAAMNIGVVTGALPAKGISLPFISYGGSGLVMMSFAVGLLVSVARRSGTTKGSDPFSQGREKASDPDEVPPKQPQPLVYRPAPVRAAGEVRV